METLSWIIVGGLAMSAIAAVGSVTLIMKRSTLGKVLSPLVALAAGSLLGGAFFHMMPAGLAESETSLAFFGWVLAGFVAFFVLEQFLHWQHCGPGPAECKGPLTYLILIGDGLHNFVGGLRWPARS